MVIVTGASTYNLHKTHVATDACYDSRDVSAVVDSFDELGIIWKRYLGQRRRFAVGC